MESKSQRKAGLGIKNGWELIKDSVRVFNRHPTFLVPLLITWTVYAPIILYMVYGFNAADYSKPQIFGIVFLIIFIFSFILSFSCCVLLELIQQLESGRKMNLLKAAGDTIGQNLFRAMPLVFIWAIIWFVLTIIHAIVLKITGVSRNPDEPLTPENAAKTLAGWRKYTLSDAVFETLEKGLRMIMFLILPAIAWENLNFSLAIKKGTGVLKAHLGEFATGFALTELAASIVFLPPSLFFYTSSKLHINYPDIVWYITLVYTAFAWSYSIYFEQMYCAELYLWNMKWEKAVEKAKQDGSPFPFLKDVPRPSVLDDISEFLK